MVEAATLSMIEQMYPTDEFNLQDHYESFETCYGEGLQINLRKNKEIVVILLLLLEDPKGNECETAYLIYKCAMDYVEFLDFIAQVDSNTTAVRSSSFFK